MRLALIQRAGRGRGQTMRTRFWLVGILLAALGLAGLPAPLHAAIWPFSMFTTKTPPKKHKPKHGKPKPGMSG
jgi:hypothetical protein